MRKLFITAIIALGALTASAQSTKPNTQQKEVKALDSTKTASITIKLSVEQIEQIQAILNQASSVISASNAPMNQGVQTVQALAAVIAFFKQYEPQQKK